MLIEYSTIKGLPVLTADATKIGTIDQVVLDGKQARLAGFQVQKIGLIKKFAGLNFLDALEVSRRAVIIDQANRLNPNLKDFDTLYKNFGSVVEVKAKTESGRNLGKISDLLVESESGLIIRFYLKNLLTERIIPREYLVSITPKTIIFKDIVDQPIFDSLASQAVEA